MGSVDVDTKDHPPIQDGSKRKQKTSGSRSAQKKSGRPSLFSSLIGAASLAAMLFVILLPERVPGLVPAEDKSSDWRTAWMSPAALMPHPRVALVTINDDTLDAYKAAGTRSPLDRSMLAEIVRTIDHQGACAMGLDVYVLRATTRDKDDALVSALTDARMEVVSGVADARVEMRSDQREYQAGFLARVGRSVGFLNLRKDNADDAVRLHPRGAGDGLYPTAFAQRLAEVEQPSLRQRSSLDDGQRRIAWLNVVPPARPPFLTVPAHTVPSRLSTPRQNCEIGGPTSEGSLKNRIVLVGAHFPNIDQHRTPFTLVTGRDMSGVDIHAQMTAEFLDGAARQIKEPGAVLMRLLLLALGALGFVTGWRLWQTSIVYSLGWSFGAALVVGAGLGTFYFFNMVLPFAACVMMWVFGVTAGRTLHTVRTPRARHTDGV
jgi:CHASE2 domain-containing sensor protein